MHVIKVQTVGYQVIVLDDLSLFLTLVFSYDSMTAESNPLREVVEPFALGYRPVNLNDCTRRRSRVSATCLRRMPDSS
jgi:hypothetical protein